MQIEATGTGRGGEVTKMFVEFVLSRYFLFLINCAAFSDILCPLLWVSVNYVWNSDESEFGNDFCQVRMHLTLYEQ